MTPKILIIRFSSIGDLVLTTPVIRIAKQQIEGSEVHLVTKNAFSSVVEANPYLDKVHVLENDLKALIEELKQEGFTHVIDLHNNLRSRKIKKALKLPSKSFTKLNIEKWLIYWQMLVVMLILLHEEYCSSIGDQCIQKKRLHRKR